MKRLPVTGEKSDDRELALYLAQPSKVEPFLKVKVRLAAAFFHYGGKFWLLIKFSRNFD